MARQGGKQSSSSLLPPPPSAASAARKGGRPECAPAFLSLTIILYPPSGFPSPPSVSSIAERRGRREDLEGEEGYEPSEQVYGCGRNRPFRWANPAPTGRSCPASEFSLSDPASSGPPGPGAAPGTRRAAPGRPQRPWPPYPLLLWERGCRGADVAANSKRGRSARGGAPGVLSGFLIRRVAGRRRVQGGRRMRRLPPRRFAFFRFIPFVKKMKFAFFVFLESSFSVEVAF